MMNSMEDTGLTVTRWRRYGKDRLYVECGDGVKVGWWDLATDDAHPASPEHLGALTDAVSAWRVENGGAIAEPEIGVPTAACDPGETNATRAVSLLDGEPVDPQHLSDPGALLRLRESTRPETIPDEPVRPWIDLATNHAGAAAREQAIAAREAAPVKTMLARVLGVHTDERAWRIGADGEEKVAAQLAKAAKKDPRWRFLHAIPVGDRSSDIDHLIVGPGGVFTVNAKHHPGAKIWVGGNTFMVNGNRQPYIRNSRHEAARAANLLRSACGFPVHVEGLIVTVNADDVTIKQQPDGVHVTWRNNLARWLLRHGEIHTEDHVQAIFEAARRSTTWRP